MKAIIFSYSDLESASRADAIAHNLERSNWETVVCDYSLAGTFKPSRLRCSPKSSVLTLADLGVNSIPQLSAKQYNQAFGDDIDFPAVSGLSFFSDNYPEIFPLSQTFLNTESLYYQRLRGLAARIEHLLRAINPELVIVQQGSGAISRLITAKALQAGMAWLCSESPFFPGHFLLDSAGQHFFPGKNRIDRDWAAVSARALTAGENEQVAQFIHGWQADRSTKYAQETIQGERERLDGFLRAGDGPLLFVPMQVPVDANVYHGVGGFPTLNSFYRQLIDSLTPGWRVVFKRHPKDYTGFPVVVVENPRVLMVEEISIHDLIQAADAVAVFSSNVGLETLLYGKPVITGGKPYYGGKGLTIDVQTGGELPGALERALKWQPDTDLRNRLLHYLLNDYLIREDDCAALQRRVEEARLASPTTNPRRPFLECDPPAAYGYVELIKRYDEFARRNLMPSEILAQIDIPGFCTCPKEHNDLDSGERQASAWITRIEHGHLSRYAFVASALPPGRRVLDIACGVGYGAYMLAERTGAQVTAVDGSKDSIAYARANWAHPGITYRAASAGAFFKEGAGEYDVIVSFETIEHLRDADSFLEQAWSKLRPGGVLFVSTSNSDVYLLMNHPFHVEHYDVQALRASLCRLGGVDDCQVYWQHNNAITAKPSPDSRFLIGALFKAPQARNWALAPESLRVAMPFSYTPPTSEFGGLKDVWSMLVRRRGWLEGVLTRKKR